MRRLWLVLALLLVADDALGRVGGGQSFGTGGGGGGGGFGGGGGGGDGLGILIYLLLRLVLQYPAIGIPLVIVLVVGVVLKERFTRSHYRHQVHRTHAARAAPPPRARRTAGIEALKEKDPGFSMPVLQEYLELVHRRALGAIGEGDFSALAPFVAPGAQEDLKRALQGVQRVSEVVHGGLRIERFEERGGFTGLSAVFLGSRLEHHADGERRVYFEERWHFRRAVGATSLPPEETLRLGCPSCGAAVETDTMGRCTHCGTPITRGQLQWQADTMQLLTRRPIRPPEVGFFAGGDEPSVHQPSVGDPQLAARYRAFTARHPDFDPKRFGGKVRDIFVALQQAWSDGEWSRARPFVTDPMFQNLRFYMEQYAQAGLKNRLEDIRFERMEIVKVELDAWYESVTVRLWASMKDYVEDRDGQVVGGNAKVQRRFSEYWTFLRAAGSGADVKDSVHCPSCGAPLDQVSQAGVCGYCQTKITTGTFDWVLSRIDQAAVYQG